MVEMRWQEDRHVFDALCLHLRRWSAIRMDGNFRLSIHVHWVFRLTMKPPWVRGGLSWLAEGQLLFDSEGGQKMAEYGYAVQRHESHAMCYEFMAVWHRGRILVLVRGLIWVVSCCFVLRIGHVGRGVQVNRGFLMGD